MKQEDLGEVFWSLVNTNGPKPKDRNLSRCWEWLGSMNGNLPRLRIRGESYYARRLAWEAAHGLPPDSDQFVLCYCGNERCMRHLRTRPKTGMLSRAGTRKGNAKLTEAQVRKIRALKNRKTQVEIARQFGISQSRVGFILRGESYRDVV